MYSRFRFCLFMQNLHLHLIHYTVLTTYPHKHKLFFRHFLYFVALRIQLLTPPLFILSTCAYHFVTLPYHQFLIPFCVFLKPSYCFICPSPNPHIPVNSDKEFCINKAPLHCYLLILHFLPCYVSSAVIKMSFLS